MSNWEKPDFGQPDRAHFNFEEFIAFGQSLEHEVAEFRTMVGSEPYTPPPKAEQTPKQMSEREQKLANAASFLNTLDFV